MQKSYSNYLKVSESQQILLTELSLSIKNKPEMFLQMCCFHQDFSFAVIAFFTGQKLCRQPHLCTSPSLVPFFPTTRFLISPVFLHHHLLTHHDPAADGAKGSGFASKAEAGGEKGKKEFKEGFGSVKHEAGKTGSMKRAKYWRSKNKMSQDD